MNTFREAIEFLYGLRRSGIKLGLENMQRLCGQYGDPHTSYPVIHVAGTNGKGSVVTMLESICVAAGIRCGTFTSPHLIKFNERIRVQGVPISDGDLLCQVEELEQHLQSLRAEGQECTFFEATNALAFSYFRESQVELAIIETGLGGRLDSTNVVDPVLSVITAIGWDHQELLGDSLVAIASEKAGIIKPEKPVVMGQMEDSCRKVISDTAIRCRSEVIESEEWQYIEMDKETETLRRRVSGAGREWELNLCSRAQIKNAATVYATVEQLRQQGWKISDEQVASGLGGAEWPARFQRINRHPDIILDGAHNADALADLGRTWTDYFEGQPDAVAFGCLKDKMNREFTHELLQFTSSVKRLIVLPIADERSATMDDIAQALAGQTDIQIEAGTVSQVMEAFTSAASDQKYIICGSLYLAGEVLARMQSSDFQPELNG